MNKVLENCHISNNTKVYKICSQRFNDQKLIQFRFRFSIWGLTSFSNIAGTLHSWSYIVYPQHFTNKNSYLKISKLSEQIVIDCHMNSSRCPLFKLKCLATYIEIKKKIYKSKKNKRIKNVNNIIIVIVI